MLLKVCSLSKSFGPQLPQALKEITFSLKRGVLMALAGPDGAGKTTLLRLIAGLLKPSSGKILFEGQESQGAGEGFRNFIAYMPQRFGLYQDLSIKQNLSLYADLKAIPSQDQEALFQELLSFTELKEFPKRLVSDLSGGMKQKLALACALMGSPKLLLLDEPTVGVDPLSRKELWKIVMKLREKGVAILWSTAYLDEPERCDQALLLHQGSLIFQGIPKKLIEKAFGRVFFIQGLKNRRRSFLSNALGDPNIIDGTIQGNSVRLLVTAEGSISSIPLPPETSSQRGSPRFEDGYMDILGKGAHIISPLAQLIPQASHYHEMPIQAQGLSKTFGSFQAVDNVSFEVPRGTIFGLLGPNGAGKSTIFKMLCGLIKSSQGSTKICGYNLNSSLGDAKSQIGYMAQKFSLYNDLSIRQNLGCFSGFYNLRGKKKWDRINEIVEIFDLENHMDESAGEVPLGIKQRLAFACCLMHRPKILFLDEPTSGVDPSTRREFWSHISALVEKGTTIMVTTHFMEEAEYCDKIALIYRGKIVNQGTPEELKNQAITKEKSSPTLEEAFVEIIQKLNITASG